jgi:hypothetical protein
VVVVVGEGGAGVALRSRGAVVAVDLRAPPPLRSLWMLQRNLGISSPQTSNAGTMYPHTSDAGRHACRREPMCMRSKHGVWRVMASGGDLAGAIALV